MNVAEFETNFTVMPTDCNYMTPLIFGGEFFARMDLAAAGLVKQVLQYNDTPADNAVTYVFDGQFHGPSYLGDQIDLYAHLVSLGNTSVKVQVTAYRTPHTIKNPARKHVATANFVFVTRKGEEYVPHNLKFDNFTQTITTQEPQ